MESFALYLFKSAVWLSGFLTVYLLLLRNERFFTLNRFFLLAGILASFLMPLLTIRYQVALPALELAMTAAVSEQHIEAVATESSVSPQFLLILLYLAGVLTMVSVMIWQSRLILQTVFRSGGKPGFADRIIRNHNYTTSFSFFSWIFVNPSATEIEAREIVNHEMVHIRQRHWIDLVLAWMLCVFQWFNPLAWFYSRLIRQNHEFIADEAALQQTADPAIYRATLLNQAAGAQVVFLVNSFNYSLTKKRFEMMKNIITSPYRRLKVLTILPVFAILLYAFSEPVYRYESTDPVKESPSTIQEKAVKGTVFQSDNDKPLESASVIVMGTTTGTSTDANGRFKLENIPDNAALAVTYVGFKSKVIKVVPGQEMKIPMEREIVDISKDIDRNAPPPPPPPPPSGKVDMETVAPPPVSDKKTDDKNSLFVVVEEMPEFPGGKASLINWISQNIKYPEAAKQQKIEGRVVLRLVVYSTGKVGEISVIKSDNLLLNDEAVRVAGLMPDWKPGSQHGKKVDVYYMIPVDFRLK